MTKLSTVILTLATTLLAFSTGAAHAEWSKSFKGTRAQVRASCQGPGMVLNEWPDTNSTSCTNETNGNSVACNQNGSCTGSGSGPNPTRVSVTPLRIIAAVLGVNGPLAAVDTGMEQSATPNNSTHQPPSPPASDPAPAPAPGGHIGNDGGGYSADGGFQVQQGTNDVFM